MRGAGLHALRAGVLALALGGIAAPAAAQQEDCPDTGLVPELTRLTQFGEGAGRTLDDVRYDVVVRSMSPPACREKDRRVNMAMRLNFDVQRGRTTPAGRVQFSYFVAIMHRVTKQIIAKEVFPVVFDFPANRGTVVIEEELEQVRFRLAKDEKPIYYAILVGLQLTEEQLAYNRVRRGESPEAARAAAGGKGAVPALPTLPGLTGAPPVQAPAPQQAAPRSNLPTLPKSN